MKIVKAVGEKPKLCEIITRDNITKCVEIYTV